MSALKVLVVDDHALIRQGLRPLLQRLAESGDGAVTVLEAAGYGEALERIAAHPDLDLVLLDLRMPDVTGFAALADIEERHPGVPVVVMTGEEDPVLMHEAIEHGALGFIPKSSAPGIILGALRLVLAGGTYIPPEMVGAPGRPAPAAPPPPGASQAAENLGITPRQSDVLALLLAGKSNKVIARELSLSEGTVKNHVAALLKTLGVDTRVQAVIAAARLGLR